MWPETRPIHRGLKMLRGDSLRGRRFSRVVWIWTAVLTGLFLLSALPTLAQFFEFRPLGDLSGGLFLSSARDVSPDGSVVVGSSLTTAGMETFRWTAEDGIAPLGALLPPSSYIEGYGVSDDGSVTVVGFMAGGFGDEAFCWTADDGTIPMGDLFGGSFQSSASDASDDGSVVVGYSSAIFGDEAFRWTVEGGMVGLGDLPGGSFFSHATAVSADGSVVVGNSSATLGGEAFRWTVEEGMVGLGDLPGGSYSSSAWAVSTDGSVVVGMSRSSVVPWPTPYRWTAAEGMIGLGCLPGYTVCYPFGVSDDGSCVVGLAEPRFPGPTEAFIWQDSIGMRPLAAYLAERFGFDLSGWSLHAASDISADGLTIVGWGQNPSGDIEAWIVRPKRALKRRGFPPSAGGVPALER